MTSIMLKPLNRQVVVHTGSTSGIGLSTVRLLASRGARLVISARNAEALEALRQELSARTDVEAVVADVGVEADVARLRDKAVERFGGFDSWINNAGIAIYGELTQVTNEDERRLFDTNYWGVVYGSRVAVAHLASKGGALINVGSVLSDRAIPLQGAYCASKHAVKAWTDTLRMELVRAGAPVSVTLVKPSAIDTPFSVHAKNYMDVDPQLPPPPYVPGLVAEAIAHALENPLRDVIVGGVGFLTSASSLTPALTDAGMVATMFDAQRTNRPKSQDRRPALFEAGQDGEERGDYEGTVLTSSPYTRASLHPVATIAVSTVLGVAATALVRGLAAGRRATRRDAVARDAVEVDLDRRREAARHAAE